MKKITEFIAYNIALISFLTYSAFMAMNDHSGLSIASFICGALCGIIPKTKDEESK